MIDPQRGFFMPKLNLEPKNGPWIIIHARGHEKCGLAKYHHHINMIHPTLSDALREAGRLSERHGGKIFAVYECIGFASIPKEKPISATPFPAQADG